MRFQPALGKLIAATGKEGKPEYGHLIKQRTYLAEKEIDIDIGGYTNINYFIQMLYILGKDISALNYPDQEYFIYSR